MVCVVVHSIKLSSHKHVQYLLVQDGFLTLLSDLVTSINTKVSHSTTATTHILPLEKYSEPALCECYSVCDQLLIDKP